MQSKAQRNFLVAKGRQVHVIVIVRGVVVLIVCVFPRVHPSGRQTRNSAGEAVKAFQRCIGPSPLQSNRHGYDSTWEGSHRGTRFHSAWLAVMICTVFRTAIGLLTGDLSSYCRKRKQDFAFQPETGRISIFENLRSQAKSSKIQTPSSKEARISKLKNQSCAPFAPASDLGFGV